MYHQIIVPLDRSSLAEQALPLGVALARWSGATLRLVHVHPAILPLLELGRLAAVHTPRRAIEDALVRPGPPATSNGWGGWCVRDTMSPAFAKTSFKGKPQRR